MFFYLCINFLVIFVNKFNNKLEFENWIKFTINIMNEYTAPIRITKNALGYSKPEIDLLVSPNHSMLIGNRLIFAKNLVNGTTIYQDMSFKKIEYFHILSDDTWALVIFSLSLNVDTSLSPSLSSM